MSTQTAAVAELQRRKVTMSPEKRAALDELLRRRAEKPEQPPQPSSLYSGIEGISADPIAKIRPMIDAIPATGSIAGQVGGGLAGTLVGHPIAGEAIGGAIGSGGGELLRQKLGSIGAPQAPPVDFDAVLGEAGFGGATGLLGAGIGRAAGAFKRTVPPQAASDLAILKREGIPYTAGDVRPGGVAQQGENLLRGTLFGGRAMESSTGQQAQALAQFKTKVLDNIGPLLSKEETGKLLQGGIEARSKQLFDTGGVFSRAYGRVAMLFPAQIDTQAIRQKVAPLKQQLDNLLQEGRIPAAKSGESPARFYALVDDLSKYGTAKAQAGPKLYGPDGLPIARPSVVDVKLTYADVWQDKQTLDSIVRSMGKDDPLRTRAKAMAVRLDSILDESMESSAAKLDPKAGLMIRNINRGYRNAKQLFQTDSLVSDISGMDPEKVVDKFFPRGATTAPAELVNALSANRELLPVVRRRAVENIIEPLLKEYEGTEVISGKMLDNKFRAMLPTLKKVLEPAQIKGIQEFIDAAKRVQTSQAMTNPASGRQMLAYGQFVNLATLGSGGYLAGTGDPAAAAVVVFTPLLLAKALTRPSVAKLLAEGFTIKRGTREAAKWTARMGNAYRSITKDEDTPKQNR